MGQEHAEYQSTPLGKEEVPSVRRQVEAIRSLLSIQEMEDHYGKQELLRWADSVDELVQRNKEMVGNGPDADLAQSMEVMESTMRGYAALVELCFVDLPPEEQKARLDLLKGSAATALESASSSGVE